jgi:catechol 2,3-dioxygenase-like lactoylglutathione lyase family enzyme
MIHPILGLHHVTATVDDAQADLDFCLSTLGAAPGEEDGELRQSPRLSLLLRVRSRRAGNDLDDPFPIRGTDRTAPAADPILMHSSRRAACAGL